MSNQSQPAADKNSLEFAARHKPVTETYASFVGMCDAAMSILSGLVLRLREETVYRKELELVSSSEFEAAVAAIRNLRIRLEKLVEEVDSGEDAHGQWLVHDDKQLLTERARVEEKLSQLGLEH